MEKIYSNFEDIIAFDKNAYVKISKSHFEYHSGVFDDYAFKIPIESIRKIKFKKGKITNGLGCNFIISTFFILFDLFFNNEIKNTIELDNQEYRHNKIIISYKVENKKRWEVREISWAGLTQEKAEKIIRIVQSNNETFRS